MRFAGRALLALVALVATGCGDDERELREWLPEDHVQPAQPDPGRTPQGGAPEGQTLEATQEQIARAAAALFQTSCAGCHGTDGRGAGPAAPPGAAMPDLSDPAYHESHSDPEIGQAIAEGPGLMPGFGTQLNARGIAALVAHVRTLRGGALIEPETAPPETAPPGIAAPGTAAPDADDEGE